LSIKPSLCLHEIDNILINTVQMNVLYTTVNFETAVLVWDSKVTSCLFLMTFDLCKIDNFEPINFVNRKSIKMVEHCHL